jgi:hypothetical protein
MLDLAPNLDLLRKAESRPWQVNASPVPGTNLNELLRSLSEFAALLPALILRMLLTSPYQQAGFFHFFWRSPRSRFLGIDIGNVSRGTSFRNIDRRVC